jgi:phosphonate transport system substrate-binding protein
MDKIRFTTIQAPNQEFIIEQICSYVGKRLGIQTEFVGNIPWEARERLFDSGQVQVAWICGLPYIWKADQGSIGLELLVAPVMQGARYHDLPIYFSDVIVRRERGYRSFADLRGASWSYNEPHSQSGYNITRYTLARMGARRGYFGKAIQAGSHQASIRMVLDGKVDASAIDSTVLEIENDLDARIGADLRVLTSLGPSPIPPLVILKSVEPGLRAEIRQALSEMHGEGEGRRILTGGKIKRLAIVKDEDYDLIREMAREAETVEW